MAEYLKIENFGPILEIELDDIRPLTVFIGESGSGKSTIMKVLSLFRWMFKGQPALVHKAVRNPQDQTRIQNHPATQDLGTSGISQGGIADSLPQRTL